MSIISQRVHAILDYAVASALIAVPILLDFASDSAAAAVLSIAAGIGLVAYSLITDYSAGVRHVISWRMHLVLDRIAAVGLVVAPFVLGFDGIARLFYVSVGVAVLVVVAVTQRDPVTEGSPSTA